MQWLLQFPQSRPARSVVGDRQHIPCRGLLSGIVQSGRVGERGSGTANFSGGVVHLGDKSVNAAVPELVRQNQRSFTGRSQHHGIEVFPHGQCIAVVNVRIPQVVWFVIAVQRFIQFITGSDRCAVQISAVLQHHNGSHDLHQMTGHLLLVSIFFIEYLLGILIVQDRRLTVDRCVRCKGISLYRKCVSAQQYRGSDAPIANAARSRFIKWNKCIRCNPPENSLFVKVFKLHILIMTKKIRFEKTFFENLFTFHGKYDKIIYVTENHAKINTRA